MIQGWSKDDQRISSYPRGFSPTQERAEAPSFKPQCGGTLDLKQRMDVNLGPAQPALRSSSQIIQSQMLVESVEGSDIRHQVLEGWLVWVRGERRTWEVEGLETDNWLTWQQYHQDIMRYELQGQWDMDRFSCNLLGTWLNSTLVPSACRFIPIIAASPFFQNSELLIYHRGYAKAPWIEIDYLAYDGYSHFNQPRVREEA